MFDRLTETKKKRKKKPVQYVAIQNMVHAIVHAWVNKGVLRQAFDHANPMTPAQATERDVRYASIGTLLLFRCRPEVQHYDNRGLVKEPGDTDNNRGKRGDKWVLDTNSPKFYFEFAWPQEYSHIRWVFFNPIGSYAIPKGVRFSSKHFEDAVKDMGYIVDGYDDPNPDNSDNDAFKDNWRRLLSDYFPNSVAYFDDMTAKGPNEPFSIDHPGILIPNEPVSQDAMNHEFVYVLIEMDHGTPSGYCKVGFSTQGNLDDRKKQLQTGNPRALEYVRLFRGGQEMEKFFHRKLRHARTSGGGTEWFRHDEATRVIDQMLLASPALKQLVVRNMSDAIATGSHPYFMVT